MTSTRLMNTPADYAKIGVDLDRIEPWEDGRRDDGRPGAYEWWYFDAILDDGTALVVIFHDKDAAPRIPRLFARNAAWAEPLQRLPGQMKGEASSDKPRAA